MFRCLPVADIFAEVPVANIEMENKSFQLNVVTKFIKLIGVLRLMSVRYLYILLSILKCKCSQLQIIVCW